MIQFVRQKKREGVPAWTTFWLGGELAEEPQPSVRARTWKPSGMLYGMSPARSLIAKVMLGLWLMLLPAALGIEGAFADWLYLFGPLIIVVATIALAEVARPARLLNVLLGTAVAAGVWFFDGTILSHLVAAISGLAVVALSLPLGPIRDRYGRFDPLVRWPPRPARPRSPVSAH